MNTLSQPDHEDRCSFCGRPVTPARSLVAGADRAFICDACVDRLFRERQTEHMQILDEHVRASVDLFTGRARQVLAFAHEEALGFNHNYIGPEHLFLGLVREKKGVAGVVLSGLGIGLDKARESVEWNVGRGMVRVVGEIGLTPRAKKVVALTENEARRLGHHTIGTGHLLLSLIREGDDPTTRALETLGGDPYQVRTDVVKMLTRTGEPRED